jgi:hypothetical protein
VEREPKKKQRRHALRPGEAKYIAESLKPGVSKVQAARAAGLDYVPRGDRVDGPRRELIRKELTLQDITIEKVVLQLGRVAFWDPRLIVDGNDNILPINQWSEDAAAGVAGFDVERRTERRGDETEVYYVLKPRSRDSVRAGEILLKHLTTGLGNERGRDRLDEVIAAMKQGPVEKK